MIVLCKECGNKFKKKPAEIKRTKNNFCTRKCSGEWRSENTIAKFYSNAVKRKNGCWEWERCINKHGYGVSRYKGTIMLAHRVSWMISLGEIKDFHVLHKCDNPKCINPTHLFLGSHQDNITDMVLKGRNSSKLTRKDIMKIKVSEYNNHLISKEFGVTERTIRNIRNGTSWKHIPPPKENNQ